MRDILAAKLDDLDELVARNPKAAKGKQIIQEGRELVKTARSSGAASRSYTLRPAFGGKLWISKLKASKNSK